MNRLAGKTAIITGATGGIGGATAKLFLAEGANVMMVDLSAEKLEQQAAALGSSPRLAHHAADVSSEEQVIAVVEATLQRFGAVDVLYANAGIEGKTQPLEAVALADFERVIRTNVFGVWLFMKHCVPPMRQRGGGSIIATASVAGLIGFGSLLPYDASKHAVCGMVKTAALELGPSRIRVNGIAPGPIDNRMIRSIEEQMAPANTAAMRASLENMVALHRYGTNEEVAQLALFLASDESSYCTGSIYPIDGGFTAA